MTHGLTEKAWSTQVLSPPSVYAQPSPSEVSGVIGVGLEPQHWYFLKALQMGKSIAIKDIIEPFGRIGIRAIY